MYVYVYIYLYICTKSEREREREREREYNIYTYILIGNPKWWTSEKIMSDHSGFLKAQLRDDESGSWVGVLSAALRPWEFLYGFKAIGDGNHPTPKTGTPTP